MDQRNDDTSRLERALSGSGEREPPRGWVPTDPDSDRRWLAEHHYRTREGLGQRLGAGLERAGRQLGRFVGMGPKGWQRSDERIREDVCERLTAHGDIDATDVEVAVQDGEVTLSGTVTDRRMKRMAEDEADHVSGVKDVHNRIRLKAQEQQQGQQQEGTGQETKELH